MDTGVFPTQGNDGNRPTLYYSEGCNYKGDPHRTGEYSTLEEALLGLRITVESGFQRAYLHHAKHGVIIAHMYRDPGSSVSYIRVDFANLDAIVRLGRGG